MRRSVSGPVPTSSTIPNGTPSRTLPELVNEADEMMKKEVEEFSASISRKENQRDITSLLSLREVLKHRRSFDNSTTPSRMGTMSGASPYMGLSVPRGAWAKPDVQVTMRNAGGEVTASKGSLFADLAATPILPSPPTRPSATRSSTSYTVATTSAMQPSLFAPTTMNSYTTAATSEQASEKDHSTQPSEVTNSSETTEASSGDPAKTLTSTFTNALRFMMAPSTPIQPAETTTTSYDETIHRLALLGLDQGPAFPRIDSRPHVQYDFTIGNRLRFSCTSYYALQFSHLRKQCGVEEILMRSLERTTGWIAEGGKSKASFFKTADDRFILKTLVTAWHVSDL